MKSFFEFFNRKKNTEKNSRQHAAKSIKQGRSYEDRLRRGKVNGPVDFFTYYNDRDLFDYEYFFPNLEKDLLYVSNLKNKLVVDVGAGTTKAISETGKKYAYLGLKFKATVLSLHTEVKNHLGWKNTTITSGEVMRGFEPESVSCILASSSIAYSGSPELVVDKFDEILEPGGLVMINQSPDNLRGIFSKIGGLPKVHGLYKYVELFTSLGYEIVHKYNAGDASVILKKPNT